jgi:ribosome-binding factor A
MASKRQLQVAEVLKRSFSQVLLAEGSNIYERALVTVTNVSVAPDLASAKIYLSIYNVENKQEVLTMLEENYRRLKQNLAYRIRKHVRRVPDFKMFLDDTLDEMDKLNQLFNQLHADNQMGSEEE